MKNYLSGIELTEKEKQGAVEWINILNTAMDHIRRPLPITMSEDEVRLFYEQLCSNLVKGKILEHIWRVGLVKKYNVDYAVGYDNGLLYTEGEN